MNAQEFSLLTFLLELIRSVIFFITSFLPVFVTVWSALPSEKARDREEIKNGLDVLLVFCCVISQEVSARAVDDANTPGMLFIVLLAQHRLSRIVQYSQQL